jgi:hypothetical protein
LSNPKPILEAAKRLGEEEKKSGPGGERLGIY